MTKFGTVFLVALAVAALVGLAQPRSRGRAHVDGPAARNRRLTALAGILI